MNDATRNAVLESSEHRTVERAKRIPPEERDLLETLLAADVPFDRAIGLVADEGAQAARGALAQYTDILRTQWVPTHPEGSEVRSRLEAFADLLDPTAMIGTGSDRD